MGWELEGGFRIQSQGHLRALPLDKQGLPLLGRPSASSYTQSYAFRRERPSGSSSSSRASAALSPEPVGGGSMEAYPLPPAA